MVKSKKKHGRKADYNESETKKMRSDVDQPAVLGMSQTDKDEEELELEKLVFGGSELFVAQLDDEAEEPQLEDKEEGILDRLEKKPVWEDDDDNPPLERLSPVVNSTAQPGDISEKGKERRNRSQFERIVGAKPSWAKLKSEREKESDDESSDEEDDESLPLNRRTGNYITTSSSLPKNIINIQRMKDANIKQRTKKKITALEFHRGAQVMLAAGFDQTMNLFQVDGEHNAKIQSVFFENFPIHSAHFSASGTEVIISSDMKSFKSFDMMTGKVTVIPNIKGIVERSLTKFRVSPDGKVLAFRGRAGNIHILSAKSKEFICTLKMNGEVGDFEFSSDGSRLFSFGEECNVYIWDMNTRRCVHKFEDDGCLRGNTIAISSNNQFIATGSSSGIVNIYDDQCLVNIVPKPLRIVKNLTTPVTCTKFGPLNEMLAVSSSHLCNAAKLVHLPSCHTFTNFGDMHYQYMRCPTLMDFSPNNGYLCIGNSQGQALLYRLKHYESY